MPQVFRNWQIKLFRENSRLQIQFVARLLLFSSASTETKNNVRVTGGCWNELTYSLWREQSLMKTRLRTEWPHQLCLFLRQMMQINNSPVSDGWPSPAANYLIWQREKVLKTTFRTQRGKTQNQLFSHFLSSFGASQTCCRLYLLKESHFQIHDRFGRSALH